MNVIVNGKSANVNATTLAELHSELGLPAMVAIAIDGKVVPRSEWAATPLNEGCKLVIIKVACGG